MRKPELRRQRASRAPSERGADLLAVATPEPQAAMPCGEDEAVVATSVF
jgi:hypothetical protein